MKNVMIIGSGGREHALAWKLKQSSKVDSIYVIPGNAGTQELAENVGIDPLDFESLAEFAQKKDIDITFVGPEDPLVLGIVDFFKQRGLKIFGPNKKAALLEGSKVYAKNIMKEAAIPTAKFFVFEKAKDAYKYIDNCRFPVVVKAEGLAAGKGVIIANNKDEANQAVKTIMEDRLFGKAGKKIVLEEYLKGEEASIMVFSDGNKYYQMISAQDHKQIYEKDKGPNTGGMGAYAPTPLVTEKVKQKVDRKILKPLFKYLKENDITFKGVLFVGLMIEEGEPKVLEFNVRFGDPEAQVVLPLLKTDLLKIAEKIIETKLDEISLEWKNKKAMAVILASGGYPKEYETKKVIKGLDKFDYDSNLFVLQAGTTLKGNEVLTNGGRVLALVSLGDSYQEIYSLCYSHIDKIDFQDKYYRKDIGHKIKGVNLISE